MLKDLRSKHKWKKENLTASYINEASFLKGMGEKVPTELPLEMSRDCKPKERDVINMKSS